MEALKLFGMKREFLPISHSLNVNKILQKLGFPKLDAGIDTNIREVIVSNFRRDSFARYFVLGAPINIVARIESFSLWGEMLIKEEMFREARKTAEIVGKSHAGAKKIEKHVIIRQLIVPFISRANIQLNFPC